MNVAFTLIARSTEQLPRALVERLTLEFPGNMDTAWGRVVDSGWFCIMNSQAEKSKTFPTLYNKATHGLWQILFEVFFFLKNKALIPHLKCNRAKLCMDFSPSEWSPCPAAFISPSTFTFVILYCFKSFQMLLMQYILEKIVLNS